MSDEDILKRGGTEEDIAMYAHDVGKACMYPDYPCEICEARGKPKVTKIKVKKTHDFIRGNNYALAEMHKYLMESYQTSFDWEDINQAIEELRIPMEEF